MSLFIAVACALRTSPSSSAPLKFWVLFASSSIFTSGPSFLCLRISDVWISKISTRPCSLGRPSSNKSHDHKGKSHDCRGKSCDCKGARYLSPFVLPAFLVATRPHLSYPFYWSCLSARYCSTAPRHQAERRKEDDCSLAH